MLRFSRKGISAVNPLLSSCAKLNFYTNGSVLKPISNVFAPSFHRILSSANCNMKPTKFSVLKNRVQKFRIKPIYALPLVLPAYLLMQPSVHLMGTTPNEVGPGGIRKENNIIHINKTQDKISYVQVLGNLIWITWGGGLFLFLEYVTAGAILFPTIVGIPFGIQLWKIAMLSAFPFGKKVVSSRQGRPGLSLLMNILFLPFGLIICCTHIFFAVINALTIVGLPFAYQHMKLAILGVSPFGRVIVATDNGSFFDLDFFGTSREELPSIDSFSKKQPEKL